MYNLAGNILFVLKLTKPTTVYLRWASPASVPQVIIMKVDTDIKGSFIKTYLSWSRTKTKDLPQDIKSKSILKVTFPSYNCLFQFRYNWFQVLTLLNRNFCRILSFTITLRCKGWARNVVSYMLRSEKLCTIVLVSMCKSIWSVYYNNQGRLIFRFISHSIRIIWVTDYNVVGS